jgi:voltage-gated potassium channel
MEPVAGSDKRSGDGSTTDTAILARFEARMRLPIIVSAVLPIVIVPSSGSWVGNIVEIVTWLVFVLDYVVHLRYGDHYGRTGTGRLDLVVVVFTAPWYLIPGAEVGSFVVVLRLARLARLLVAAPGARRLVQTLGKVAVVALIIVVVSSLVAYYAERPTNPEFATVGDALWWGIVTLTTVGYGDIVPKTSTGRFAGVAIMLTGIAVLGVLAGSLSSFFHLEGSGTAEDAGADVPVGAATSRSVAAVEPPAVDDGDHADLAAAIRQLTAELAELRAEVRAALPGPSGEDQG